MEVAKVQVEEQEPRGEVKILGERSRIPVDPFRAIEGRGPQRRGADKLAVSAECGGVRESHSDQLCDSREARELDVLHAGEPRSTAIADPYGGLDAGDGPRPELEGSFVEHVAVRL